MTSDNPFCELYVDYSENREKLQSRVAEIINGIPEKYGEVTSEVLIIDIKYNELFNSPKYGGEIPSEQDDSRPFYYKYRIEIEPADDDVDSDEYRQGLRKIVNGLRDDGVKVFLGPNIIE